MISITSFTWRKDVYIMTWQHNQSRKLWWAHNSISVTDPGTKWSYSMDNIHCSLFCPVKQKLHKDSPAQLTFSTSTEHARVRIRQESNQCAVHTVSWTMTLNKELPWTMGKSSNFMGDASRKIVEQESIKLSATPLSSMNYRQTWQRPCTETWHMKLLWTLVPQLHTNLSVIPDMPAKAQTL